MKGLLFAMVWVSLLFAITCGCDPRVVQCGKCKAFGGVSGGLFPGQGSQCPCGGQINKVRDLTREDWQRVKERGYVTLEDGEPVDPVWTPNYDRTERKTTVELGEW